MNIRYNARDHYAMRKEDRPVQVWYTSEGKEGGVLAPTGNEHIKGAVPHKVLFKTKLSA
jgi:hypothetical protein